MNYILVFCLSTISFLANSGSNINSEEVQPYFRIGIKSNETSWILKLAEDKFIFEGFPRHQLAEDKIIESPPKVRLCDPFFEPAGGRPPIVVNRFARLDSICDRSPLEIHFVSKDKTVDGYLTTDFTTQPPSVRLEKRPSKASQWHVCKSEDPGFVFIGQGNPFVDKTAWLSMVKKGRVKSFVLYASEKQVIEYHDATISYDEKYHFKINIGFELAK